MKRGRLDFLFLFAVWIAVTVWAVMQYDKSFFSLTASHPTSSITNFSEEKILKSDKVSGSFQAVYDNLGTVSLNITYFNRVSFHKEDRLVFKLKEKGSDFWYFEAPYRTGLMYDATFYPFGFPVIANSKGKIYEFELTSLYGNEVNSIALEKGYPTLESRYIVPRSVVLKSPTKFAAFISDKFIGKLTTLEIIFISASSLIPLIVYIFWSLILYRFLKDYIQSIPRWNKIVVKIAEKMYVKTYDAMRKSYYAVLGGLLILAVIIDILFVHTRTDILYIVVILLWIRSGKNNKNSELISAVVAIKLLIFCPILLGIGTYESALRAGAWSLIFFLCSVIFILVRRNFDK